ncbi:uncharacterized protein LOC112493319 [Ziziphus jujuba]|uniref:Uncharacterized protein LOC112493319 n=1 Tax=Ziziphus jujuba TaxID=326968 RepID=A0A6P6GKC4_ZIZJJ|nr:uncharacterized protein LOC112493319 [Ziziphus jujuba]
MPNPKTRYHTKATAIMVLGSEPLRFKIVRFSERKSAHIMYKCEIYYNVRCEIFDSETWAWKEENDIRLPYGVYFSNSNHPSVASACGKLYWLLSDNQIFVFDLNNESWKIFSLPKSLCEKDIHHQLVEYEGRLGLVSMGKDEDCLALWVMKEFGKIKVWGKRLEISMEDIREREYHTCPTAFCNADVAIFKGFSRMMFYNFQNHKNSKDVPLKLPFLYARDVFSLQSDFEDANFCWN